MLSTAPTQLGRYKILDEIGRGAMGVVYLAKDPLIGRLVALKTFHMGSVIHGRELDMFRARFIREAQSAGILSHPNIVTIHDVVEESEEGATFIAMEYVRGTDLKEILYAEKRPGLEEVVNVVGQVAEGLDYAHSKGVVHRDVKPANILITQDRQVKLTDFGIARLDTSNLTLDGQLLGTPNYMAPEQIQGEETDHRADIFSLGVVLYEMLTGEKPFRGENVTVVTHRIVYDSYTPPEEHVGHLPERIQEVLARALAKDPDDRYARVRDLADELRVAVAASKAQERLNETQVILDPGSLEPPAPPPVPASSAGRRPEPPGVSPGARIAAAGAAAGRGLAAGVRRTAHRLLPPPERRPPLPRVLLVAAVTLVVASLLGGLLLFAASWSGSETQPRPQDLQRQRALPLLREAAGRLREGDPAAALVLLQEAEKVAPDIPRIRARRREVADQAHALDRLEERSNRVAQGLETARIAAEGGHWQEAREAAQTVLEIEPESDQAQQLVARSDAALAKLERRREAVAAGPSRKPPEPVPAAPAEAAAEDARPEPAAQPGGSGGRRAGGRSGARPPLLHRPSRGGSHDLPRPGAARPGDLPVLPAREPVPDRAHRRHRGQPLHRPLGARHLADPGRASRPPRDLPRARGQLPRWHDPSPGGSAGREPRALRAPRIAGPRGTDFAYRSGVTTGAAVTLDPALDFGRYELLREIGRGASGTVYLARDSLIGRDVAIKSFLGAAPPADRGHHGVHSLRDDLLREARSAGVLSHPNIVKVYDLVERPDRTVFMAMEYVRGRNLGELLAAGRRLDFERAVDLTTQVASALDYLHTMGVVHRDIKPANILIDESGQVKLTDFGIALLEKRPVGDDADLILGTPSYMAPEQLLGREVTRRADVYSLGVVLFEMLVGRRPFEGANVAEVVHQIVHAPLPDVSRELAGLSPRLGEVFERALAKDPEQRYASAGELAAMLRRILYRAAGEIDAGSASATQVLDRSLLGLPSGAGAEPASRWLGADGALRPRTLALLILAGALAGALATGAVLRSRGGTGPAGLAGREVAATSPGGGPGAAAGPAAEAGEPGVAGLPGKAQVAVELTSEASEGVVTIYADGLELLRRGFSYSRRGPRPYTREPSGGEFDEEIAVPAGTGSLWVYVARPREPARRLEVPGEFTAGTSQTLEIHVAADGEAAARLRPRPPPALPAPRAEAPAPRPVPPR